jgi:hypothetical protein
MDTGFALSQIDTTTPHPARMYDAYLGKDNYAADRQAVRQLLKAAPEVRDSARANRAFLQRAVRFLADEAGIRLTWAGQRPGSCQQDASGIDMAVSAITTDGSRSPDTMPASRPSAEARHPSWRTTVGL